MPGSIIPAHTRVCDWAAQVIAKAHDELEFDIDAPVAERDERIAAMRAALRTAQRGDEAR